jgi:hypothetical protein
MVMSTTTNIFKSLLVFLSLSAAFSCSNEFLNQEKPVAAPVADTIRMTSLETAQTVNFNLLQAGNAHWRVFQFPSWTKITPMEGNFNDGKTSFQVEIIDKSLIPTTGLLSLPLVFDVEGTGYVQYPFLLINFGNPQPVLSTSLLTLDYQTNSNFTLHNTVGGILLWEVTSKPSWIKLSSEEGYLNVSSAQQIFLTITRDNLTKGDYSGEIVISTNSATVPNLKLMVTIKVFDPTISGNAELIEGDVVDAAFCKATGALVVAVKNPNRMYLYQSGQVKKQLDLQKIPINVAISEKGDLIAASFTNTDLIIIDPVSFTIQKDIKTGMISSDLALGENGWAYLSPKAYDTNNLVSIDLNTGQLVKNNKYLTGLSWLKKIPGKSLLYGSLIGWSPDYLLVFDISAGAVNPVIDEWWTTLMKFWPSEDGKRLFTGSLKVYQSPDYQATGSIIIDNPVLLGQLEPISGTIHSMEHSAVLKEIIVAYKSYNYEAGSQIQRMDDTGYFVKKTFSLNNITMVENENLFTIIPEVPYMFVNKAGKELYLVKVAKGNSGKNYWYYEKIDL